MRHIPNFITSLNLASGFISVVLLFTGNTVAASWVIVAAMIFDFLDGAASRLLNAYSDIGKELDSLADMVSFGVAPGIIIYTLLDKSTLLNSEAADSILIAAVSALVPVCAGFRLAKFNIDTTQRTTFRGLPTPAAALAVVSLVLSSSYSESEAVKAFAGSGAALVIFSLAVSLLMVTRLPLLSLKFHDLKFKGNEGRYTLICISLLLVVLLGWAGILLVIPSYLVVSLLSEAF
jgi:CDP-diacylglycerol--serine O-phosphatidyltransferase